MEKNRKKYRKGENQQANRYWKDLLDDTYVLEHRGDVDIKGKGVLETWWLEGSR